MKRSNYFNYIEEKLNILACRIEVRGKINLLDLNIYSETFFADLLNLIFNFNLKNLNAINKNIEGIDLVDEDSKIIAQVSSTCTKQKIESSLAKKILKKFKGYTFKFISISKDAGALKTLAFSNPHETMFSPLNDIIDMCTIINMVLDMSIEKQKQVYELIKQELGSEVDIVKVDSNLATIINILSCEDWSGDIELPEINAFEIGKKIVFNNLTSVQDVIDEYKVYYHKLNEKYFEFDKQGMNKSISVLSAIKNCCVKLWNRYTDPHDLFFATIDAVIERVIASKNYTGIPYEELEMCVYILVVDAFIRCKIFKNPEVYNYVVTR